MAEVDVIAFLVLQDAASNNASDSCRAMELANRAMSVNCRIVVGIAFLFEYI